MQGRRVVRSCGLLLLALVLTLIWLVGSHLVVEALPNDNGETNTFRALSDTPDLTAANPQRGDTRPRVVQFGLKRAF